VTEAEATASQACPKCGRKCLPEAKSCPRCGLVFELWQAESSIPLASLDDIGAALWRKLEASWSDTALHEELLKHCLQTGSLAAAGRLYRDRLDQDPKDSIAAHMQGQVLAKAAVMLSVQRTQPRSSLVRNRWFWVIVLVAMALGIAAGLFWRRMR
jgi:hypothetical protein